MHLTCWQVVKGRLCLIRCKRQSMSTPLAVAWMIHWGYIGGGRGVEIQLGSDISGTVTYNGAPCVSITPAKWDSWRGLWGTNLPRGVDSSPLLGILEGHGEIHFSLPIGRELSRFGSSTRARDNGAWTRETTCVGNCTPSRSTGIVGILSQWTCTSFSVYGGASRYSMENMGWCGAKTANWMYFSSKSRW